MTTSAQAAQRPAELRARIQRLITDVVQARSRREVAAREAELLKAIAELKTASV